MKKKLSLPVIATLAVFAALLPLVGLANTAVEPVPRGGKAAKQHSEFVELGRQGDIDVLFLGDSITNHWRNPKRGKPIWDREFAPLKAANFGISSDRTQHVLWRLRNGEVENFSPKVVVLLIGTNNTGWERDGVTPRNSTEEVIEGVTAVVHKLRKSFPEAKILLLGILPRGEKDAPQRAQIREINEAISHLNDDRYVFFLDIGDQFLDADGNIPVNVMPDLLHPSRKGYEIWADSIREPLAKLLQ